MCGVRFDFMWCEGYLCMSGPMCGVTVDLICEGPMVPAYIRVWACVWRINTIGLLFIELIFERKCFREVWWGLPDQVRQATAKQYERKA
jgi:hypothetical protein